MLKARNPKVDIWLDSTWSRADLTYQPAGHWYGKPIDAMEKEVRVGYDKAAAANPGVHGVLPVGDAFNRAIISGFATANPYQGTAPNQINLWATDSYHASSFGYYLEALVAFGDVTARIHCLWVRMKRRQRTSGSHRLKRRASSRPPTISLRRKKDSEVWAAAHQNGLLTINQNTTTSARKAGTPNQNQARA